MLIMLIAGLRIKPQQCVQQRWRLVNQQCPKLSLPGKVAAGCGASVTIRWLKFEVPISLFLSNLVKSVSVQYYFVLIRQPIAVGLY